MKEDKLKIVPKERIAELFDAIYASEVNFSISWFWDGGIDWYFGDGMNGIIKPHDEVVDLANSAFYRDKQNQIQYAMSFALHNTILLGFHKDTEGNLNHLGLFYQSII